MTEILTDLSTPALVKAIQQSLYDLGWEFCGHWAQANSYENNRLRRWWSPIPYAFIFNAALSIKPPVSDESDLIGETIAFFQSRERNAFDWWLSPGLESSDWGRQLESHGLMLEEDTPGMAIDLGALSVAALPAGVTITTVQDNELMKTWVNTFILGYELPLTWEPILLDMMLAASKAPITCYLAAVSGQPVAASLLYLDAGAAGIYNVATLSGWRGKGIGAAVTLKPLHDARQMGYRAGILQSSELGYRVYQRLGFKELCQLRHYRWQGEERGT